MQLSKAKTGIIGLDELTGGGLPKGRPTLVCGPAGCGKTLLGMEFLVRGALEFGEPGVFMAFEETVADLTTNVASLGFDLDDLVARRMLAVDFVRVARSELEQCGEYDLEGLFVRLAFAIDSIGAKRVVLDTVEALFLGLHDPAILRAELQRLFRWLKDKGVTAIVTGERGDQAGSLTRQGLEEYVSDCVIVLDNPVTNLISSRRLRVVKYRGSTHGNNEYPFLIDSNGISLLPITSLGLEHEASVERVPSGVAGLDDMLGGDGYYRGSSVLVSGTAGTGKSSFAAHFAAACRRGARVLYFAFEESPAQIMRNMAAIGLDLRPAFDGAMLRFHASRPTLTGLEMHLAIMFRQIALFDPQVVIVDPLNSFVNAGNANDVKLMLLRLVDSLKRQQITGFFTSLTAGGKALEQTDIDISSLIDTWLLVRDLESGGERNRALSILKSRGMAHSNQIRTFFLTADGIALNADQRQRDQDIARMQSELNSKRAAMESTLSAIRADFALQEAAALSAIEQELVSQDNLATIHRQRVHLRTDGRP
ncbi:circadian clock protein KaiC [Massilia sp. TSP1-1-2]|uniref:circadian clock protein KaiC n=1 Tax=Massilia sp. TSP1-1-2 TaxID=2804649 RepID=UPI003CEB823F